MRVLLLLPTTTYKASDFLEAAEKLGVDVVVGCDRRQALERQTPGHTITLDFARPERSVARIVEHAAHDPFDAVLGVDDETTVLAATAGAALGLAHNSVEAARAARDKYESRRLLRAAGLHGPGFRRFGIGDSPVAAARAVDYPCVLKPLSLSASRGVIRADDEDAFVEAFRRIVAILRDPDVDRRDERTEHVLVEDYLDGPELALEGLLDDGRLRVLALFDKPDPLEGPTFEETIFVTPSRLPDALQAAIAREAAAGCRALGLRTGPVHAELRLTANRPWIIEIAARTIGGLCSRALRFGAGISLEELILHHAIGSDPPTQTRESLAAGVMMIPVPRRGVLTDVRGLERAREVPHVDEVTLTVHRGAELVPLPEGHRYVGFIFARGPTPGDVEQALRDAHAALELDVR